MLFLVNSLIQALVQLSSEVIVFHSAPADGQKQFLIPGFDRVDYRVEACFVPCAVFV